MRKALYHKDGTPVHIKVMDNGGKTLDRYTVIFKYAGRRYKDLRGYVFFYSCGVDPQGMSYTSSIEAWKFACRDKVIPFSELPPLGRCHVFEIYKDLWGPGQCSLV